MRTSSHHMFYRPGLRLPDECLARVDRFVDNRTLACNRAEVMSHVHREMREALAHHISHAKLTITPRDFDVHNRMEVMVFSPDEFNEIVEAEVARRLSLDRDMRMSIAP